MTCWKSSNIENSFLITFICVHFFIKSKKCSAVNIVIFDQTKFRLVSTNVNFRLYKFRLWVWSVIPNRYRGFQLQLFRSVTTPSIYRYMEGVVTERNDCVNATEILCNVERKRTWHWHKRPCAYMLSVSKTQNNV